MKSGTQAFRNYNESGTNEAVMISLHLILLVGQAREYQIQRQYFDVWTLARVRYLLLTSPHLRPRQKYVIPDRISDLARND